MIHIDTVQSELLDKIGIVEFLELDTRPTLVLDLASPRLATTNPEEGLKLVFCNQALRSHCGLYDLILSDIARTDVRQTTQDCSAAFGSWTISASVSPVRLSHRNLIWSAFSIHGKWKVISGTPCDVSLDADSQDFQKERFSKATIAAGALDQPAQADFDSINSSDTCDESSTIVRPDGRASSVLLLDDVPGHPIRRHDSSPSLVLSSPDDVTPDWTVPRPTGLLRDHLVFARSIDWASTSLGAMSTWSRELRQAANLVMANPHPAALFWGSDFTLLYNEAYRDEVAGNKHPSLMGTGFEGPFREIWEQVRPIFVECARTGKSVRRDNDYLPLVRHGYGEEAYFSWSMSPLYGGGQKILGFYNAPFETTRDFISHRRMLTLQRLGNAIAGATSVKQFWQCILSALEDNHNDVPFALLYSMIESDNRDDKSRSLKSCSLEGSVAIPHGHPAILSELDLDKSQKGFIPAFRSAMRVREPTMIQVQDGSLPASLLEGIEIRGLSGQCKDAIIFPIRPTNGDSVLAFLLLGINPGRAYDDDYRAFVNLMNRQLATALASVLLFEDEIRRAQNVILAATLQQKQLNEQLAVQTNRLQRMTAFSPLGMFYINPDGVILEANDRYFEMTSQNRQDGRPLGWMDSLVESSKPVMTEGWRRLTVDLVPWTAELQLKTRRPSVITEDAGEPMEYWVLASSQPELSTDGKLRSVMGSITDISHYKWAQGLQERRLREAEERRRQQNEFIDLTLHEMRNPLSAILQCAEDITSSMTEYQAHNSDSTKPVIDSCIESANTISFCVQHQKSIIDDILTVSKLDSNLLKLAPIPSQPIAVATGVAKMFESELLAKQIKYNFIVEPEYGELGVDWVNMDPSRMSQILINLMTNAIKFTKDRPVREIKMRIAAFQKIPSKPDIRDFQYIPRRNNSASIASDNDWNPEDTVYIRILVIDTGCGLTSDEKQLLFGRFQQASPRTHAQYGGSGLGLFISRQLTELHDGQIGVASRAGQGSTFGFYIKTRRTLAPQKELSVLLAPTVSLLRTTSHDGRPSRPEFVTSQITGPHKSATVPERPRPVKVAQSEPILPNAINILVVEDNLVNQRVLVKQLRKSGFTVFTADHGREALEFLGTTDFCIGKGGQKLSVVLMDLEMPVMDGLTCVRTIRQLQKDGSVKRHVPVIAVTANVRPEQIVVAKAAGMDDVVSKPFRIPDLVNKVNILLGQVSQPI